MHTLRTRLAAAAMLLGWLLLPFGRPLYAATPGLVVSDQESTWAQNHSCDLFRHAQLDEAVVHPGTQGSYRFKLQNTAGFDMHYTLDLEDLNPDSVPMEYRLRSGDTYLLGGEETWADPADFSGLSGLLRAGAAYQLELDWRWVFTSGAAGDAYDTGLGEAAAVLPAQYTVTIVLTAEQIDESGGGGGTGTAIGNGNAGAARRTVARGGAQTGEIARRLLLPALLAGTTLAAVFARRRRRRRT